MAVESVVLSEVERGNHHYQFVATVPQPRDRRVLPRLDPPSPGLRRGRQRGTLQKFRLPIPLPRRSFSEGG
jgi:hypothetical protein